MRQIFSRSTGLIPAVLLFGTSAFAADPQLMNLVMPDAQVMAGVNVTTAKTSPLGQYVLAQIAAGDQGLQDFITQTGFDPRKDVAEILAASSGNPASPNGLVLAKGNFNVAQIVAALPAGKGQTVGTYGGATLISATDGKQAHGVAFLGGTIAVAGDLDSVKAAIDRSKGVSSVSPALASQVQALSAVDDAWSVSIASLASLLPAGALQVSGGGQANQQAAQAMQFFKNIQSSNGGVKFGSTIQLTAQAVADTPQSATALADVIRMVASLVSVSGGGTAQPSPITGVLQTLQVSTSGSAVNISASVTEAQVEALLKSATLKAGTAPAPQAKALHARRI